MTLYQHKVSKKVEHVLNKEFLSLCKRLIASAAQLVAQFIKDLQKPFTIHSISQRLS